MKSLFYALVLLAVLVAAVVVLRSFDTEEPLRATLRTEPIVSSRGPVSVDLLGDDTENTDASELVDLGDELLNLWHVREATDVFERALRADSTRFDACTRLIECYAHPLVGGEDPLRAVVSRARPLASDSADAHYLQGLEQLFILGAYIDAAGSINAARHTAGFDERFPSAQYFVGLAQLRAGRLHAASRIAEDLLSDDDTDGRALVLAVRCAVAMDELDIAQDRSRSLARVFSEEPFPYVLLALVELQRGEIQHATEFCNNALVLDAKYLPAVAVRANLYALAGEGEAARVSFEKFLLFDDPVLQAVGESGIAFVSFLTGRFDDGVDAMDEAIRHAMLAGAARKGLQYSQRLVEYLCELGQADAAEGVVERWISGFGDIAASLASVRIHIVRGETMQARQILMHMHASKEWINWAETMTIDGTEMNALVSVGEREPAQALELIARASDDGATAHLRGRREFVRGYAAFEAGDAETATAALLEVRRLLYGMEFPHHGDPVLAVQSHFFLAESALARGDETAARTHYQAFVDAWGESTWELAAIARAREKLSSLTTENPTQKETEETETE